MFRLFRGLSTTPAVTEIWASAAALGRGYVISATTATATAAALLIGGDDRIQAVGFAEIRATGGAVAWGLIYASVAVALIVAPLVSDTACRWATFCASVVFLLWALGFVEAAISSGESSFIGAIDSSALAAICASQSETYRRRRP